MYTLTNTATHAFPAVYALSLLKTPAGLAALTSDQRLTILDPATLTPRSHINLAHGESTSSLVAYAGDVVCTAGEDGQVGVWDVRTSTCAARFTVGNTAPPAPILALAASPSTHTLALGAECTSHVASITLYDVRATPAPLRTLSELHSDDITSLALRDTTLLSASTDGLVSAHDVTVHDEDEMTLQTFNLNAPIHRAGFLGAGVFALSHDERFAVYDERETLFGDLRPRLGCRYVAEVLAKDDGLGALLGAGAQDEGKFQLIFLSRAGETWTLGDEVVDLPGAHGGDVVRSFVSYDESQTVFTAGEDGCVKAWRPM